MLADVAWALGSISVCAGLFYVAYLIEPHWVSRDGTRFLTTAQPIDRSGRVLGRRREVRVAILADGTLMVSRRSFLRSTDAVWRIEAKAPQPPRRRHVYLLRQIPPDPDGDLLALRVPASSKVVAALDDLSPPGPDPRANPVPVPDPGTRRWGRRADRG